jgi:sortase A
MHRSRISGQGASRVAITLAAVVALAVAPTSAADARPGAARAGSGDGVHYSSGKPRHARLTIPARPRIHRVPVVPYRGKTDDGPGTRIQNRGIAASPFGPHGGIGPGGIGNYQVTGHRTAHGGIFRDTPSLRNGARVWVDSGRWRYVYLITRTRWVSFRSAKSLRKQRAAVPGHPGVKPRHGYITISTCATPEDHARGNYWTDRFGNPEHRIDKIGKLVAVSLA